MSLPTQTSVIIIGGSLVGLSTALFLSSRGVPLVLLERHPGSSPHPRALGYTARTLETFRSVGLTPPAPAPALHRSRGRAAGGGPPRRVSVQSLAGTWRDEKFWTSGGDSSKNGGGGGGGGGNGPPKNPYEGVSPVAAVAVSQDILEPLLRSAARENGADLRLGYKVTGWTQTDSGGVSVRAVDAQGVSSTIQGQYLVACDGAHSPVREALGITRSGVGHLKVLRSILFECAQLDEYLEAGIGQFQIEGREDGFEAFLVTYGDGRWALMWSPTEGEKKEEDKIKDNKEEGSMSPAAQRSMIRKAAGSPIPDSAITLVTTGEWQLSGLVADAFSCSRVFLAGDAAHALPPNRGGYGANTGIADAHNLAWKLAAVLRGESTPDLLATYDAERRPVAVTRHDQIFVRDDYSRYVVGMEWEGKGAEILDDVAMELGQVYRSAGVESEDDGEEALAKRPGEWNGRAGTRAPHVPLRRGDEDISSLDLFCRGWVLVSRNGVWAAAARLASDATGIDVEFVRVGEDTEVREVEEGSVGMKFGIGEEGASLVRPDGYVAWRSAEGGQGDMKALEGVLGRVSFAAKGKR